MRSKPLDLLIVGAGPAGLQCARAAHQKGLSCLVVEKAKSFLDNNYSSGAAPMEIMSRFSLPDSIVEGTWNKFQILAEEKRHAWEDEKNPLGVILGFCQLREFLKEEVLKQGASFFFKAHYLSSEIQENKVISKIKKNNEEWEITSSLVIDATGSDRKVIQDSPPSFDMTGSEVWVKTDANLYLTFQNTLTFFLGPSWFPQGYGWVFPQTENVLKIGVIRYFQGEDWVPHPLSFSSELDGFVEKIVGKNREILTRHGKTISYFFKRKGPHVKGRILAVGDAASTVNPLGCEGLRYALESGELAATYAFEFIKGKKSTLAEYEKKLSRLYDWRWRLTEWVAKTFYRDTNEKAYTLALDILQKLPRERLMRILFDYDPKEILLFGAKYSWKRFFLTESKKDY